MKHSTGSYFEIIRVRLREEKLLESIASFLSVRISLKVLHWLFFSCTTKNLEISILSPT